MIKVSRSLMWLALGVSVCISIAGCKKSSSSQNLIEAASAGDVAKCEQLVKGGLPVNSVDDTGSTALDWVFEPGPGPVVWMMAFEVIAAWAVPAVPPTTAIDKAAKTFHLDSITTSSRKKNKEGALAGVLGGMH